MHSSSPTAVSTATATTYTTLPISGSDVISRSIQNLTSAISNQRPWSELIAAGVFDRPESFSSALTRLRKNASYFCINYVILVSICGALSLIGVPLFFFLYGLIFGLWLILYFFREDPLILWGYHVSDRVALLGLIVCSILTIWFSGVFGNLVIGIGVAVLLCGVHGVFRNPNGLFLDENEAASTGLIGSGNVTGSGSVFIAAR